MKWANRLLLFGVMLWVQAMEVSFSPNNKSLISGLNLELAKVGAQEMTPGERANRDFQDQLNK